MADKELWNNVKKGRIVMNRHHEHYEVMDNRMGPIRMVKAVNGDIGSMYIYTFTRVLAETPDPDGAYDWHMLAVTHDQAERLVSIAIQMDDDFGVINARRMEENGKEMKKQSEQQ